MPVEPRCSERKCIHFQGISDDEDEAKQVPICAAFPGGIPEKIAYGPELHITPWPGDHGIQYEGPDTSR